MLCKNCEKWLLLCVTDNVIHSILLECLKILKFGYLKVF